VLAAPLTPEFVEGKMVRFNDGACDPAGRFWVGSMTLPTARDGKMRGEMMKIAPDGGAERMMEGVGTSNGIDWFGGKMCESQASQFCFPLG
jgi:sugar lactone lactonase YvrE